MGGLFGGLLELVDIIGGGILYVLVGKPAWRDTGRARIVRVFLGSCVLGEAIGLIGFLIGFLILAGLDAYKRYDELLLLVCFGWGPFAVLVGSLLLEALRREISGKGE